MVLHVRLLFTFLFLAFINGVHSQETKVSFKIISSTGEPLSFASLTITSLSDSNVKKIQAADSLGLCEFLLLNGSHYLAKVTHTGYEAFEKGITVKGDHPVFTLTIPVAGKSLTGIVVTASKPLMRQEDDKTIVDPESLASVSTNAYEILEKTPGLFVDQDGNIYLSSTTPATVYINGREQKMSAADIATMLKNLPPTAIASIEILRTPSAKYDASGSGGIVNVILKKGVKIGLTGSVTSGMNQGKYGNQFAGINLNNNNGISTTYINLQYGRRNTYDHINSNRIFTNDSTILNQDALTKYSSSSFYFGYGINYQLSKKWEMSYDGRLSKGHYDNQSNNESVITRMNNTQEIGRNTSDVITTGKNLNFNQGLNGKYKIDSLGSEWTTDLSYTYSPGQMQQLFLSGNGDLDSRLNFFSAQTNLLKKMQRDVTVETGLKTTFVSFRNATDYFTKNGSNVSVDSMRSGSYSYRESINAAYVQASKNFSGIILKVGTRMENTNMNGHQVTPNDTSFNIHRTDFFPYAYLSKTIMKIAGYDLRAYLVFRRTISRPSYEYLNPSSRIIDPFLYETGNPYLRPQFTKNYEANISVDERPLLAFGINDTKDIFTQVIYQTDTNGHVSKRTYDNLGSNMEHYIRFMGAIPPGGKYFFVLGGQYNHNFYEGLYDNQPLSYKKGSWMLYTYHQLKIGSLTQLSVNGFVRFNGQQQFYELSTFGELRMSINQQFLKKKLNVTLSMNDIFQTNHNEFTINQGSVKAYGTREGDTRRFGLNVRYNFGWKKKEEVDLNNYTPDKVN